MIGREAKLALCDCEKIDSHPKLHTRITKHYTNATHNLETRYIEKQLPLMRKENHNYGSRSGK